MKKLTIFVSVLSGLFSTQVLSHNIQIGKQLPQVTITKDGELTLVNNQIEYQVWTSDNLMGKVRVLQHIAGRSAVKEKNLPLMDMIKKEKFNGHKYQTTNIINADDATFGTGMFVKNSTEKAKKENPHSQLVLDQQGIVKNTWQLLPEESLIIVLDQKGKVRYVSEGKLSDTEMHKVINLVKKLLN